MGHTLFGQDVTADTLSSRAGTVKNLSLEKKEQEMIAIIRGRNCTSQYPKYITSDFPAEGKNKRDKPLWFRCQILANLIVSLELQLRRFLVT